MKRFSAKTILVTIITALMCLFGGSTATQAAPITSPSVTTSGLVQGQTNPNPITISMTSVTAGSSLGVNVTIPQGWTWAQTLTAGGCGLPTSYVSLSGFTPSFCRYGTGSSAVIQSLYASDNSTHIASGVTVTITLAPGTLLVGSGTVFVLDFADGPTVIDTATVSVNASTPSNMTVTFDANGGTGTTAAQTASSSTALTTNGFSRSGYTFAGWNTAANGSGIAYADGASYAFSSSVTLYAQWTATLANTGINSAIATSLLAGGVYLAVIGAGMFISARRKRNI